MPVLKGRWYNGQQEGNLRGRRGLNQADLGTGNQQGGRDYFKIFLILALNRGGFFDLNRGKEAERPLKPILISPPDSHENA